MKPVDLSTQSEGAPIPVTDVTYKLVLVPVDPAASARSTYVALALCFLLGALLAATIAVGSTYQISPAPRVYAIPACNERVEECPALP